MQQLARKPVRGFDNLGFGSTESEGQRVAFLDLPGLWTIWSSVRGPAALPFPPLNGRQPLCLQPFVSWLLGLDAAGRLAASGQEIGMRNTLAMLAVWGWAGFAVAASVQVQVQDGAGKPVSNAVVFLESPEAARLVKPLTGVQVAQEHKQFVPQVITVTRGTPKQPQVRTMCERLTWLRMGGQATISSRGADSRSGGLWRMCSKRGMGSFCTICQGNGEILDSVYTLCSGTVLLLEPASS